MLPSITSRSVMALILLMLINVTLPKLLPVSISKMMVVSYLSKMLVVKLMLVPEMINREVASSMPDVLSPLSILISTEVLPVRSIVFPT